MMKKGDFHKNSHFNEITIAFFSYIFEIIYAV